MTRPELFRANSRLVIERFRSSSDLGDRFGFDRESVERIERFIENERNRRRIPSEELSKLVTLFGAYLGEAIVHKYGGSWREHSEGWGVFFDDSNAVFPFTKVLKQFENGMAKGDSILSFFDLVGLVILRKSQR